MRSFRKSSPTRFLEWRELDRQKRYLADDSGAFRKFFPPTSAEQTATNGGNEATDGEKQRSVEDGNGEPIPALPDVPTEEPSTKDGQPEAKKVRLDEGGRAKREEA